MLPPIPIVSCPMLFHPMLFDGSLMAFAVIFDIWFWTEWLFAGGGLSSS